MKLKLFSLVLFVCISSRNFVVSGKLTKQSNLKLELVQVLFRHGERTPQSDEAKLIGNTSRPLQEPYGFSQLTNNGKQQEYRIGTVLRDLYNEHLGDEYKPEYVYAQSTDFDRTKVSLQLVLASLYPPAGRLVWNDDIQWLPIPTQFTPRKLDNLLLLDQCPKYDSAYKRLMKTSEIQEKINSYEDLFQFLEEIYPNINFDLEQVFYVNNFLNIQKTLDVPAPAWYRPDIHARITECAKFYLDTLSYNPTLIRMNGGPLIRRMIENIESSGNPRKIYLYSAHEYNVYAFAKANNIDLDRSPAYGSAMILEKLRDEQTDRVYVRLLYWTGVSQELVQLNLNDADFTSIEDYKKLLATSLPTDDELRCLFKFLSPRDLEKILRSDSYATSA